MPITVQDILDEIIPSPTPVGMSQWDDGPSDGGYIIRKDGEVFSIGEFQEAPERTFSTLMALSARELAKIYAHLCPVNYWIDDFNNNPAVFGYDDPKALRDWIDEPVS